MQEPTLNFLQVPGPRGKGSADRRLAWWDWNATGQKSPARVVVCVHGLTRQARDFDTLAMALSKTARVVCVDVAGRGHSDWLEDPMGYQIPNYATDLAVLLAHLRQVHAHDQAIAQGHKPAEADAEEPALQIDWVGTSMGGLIGLVLAAQPAIGIRRLVLNDVGPVLQVDALDRIGTYLGVQPVFASEQAAADYLWQISQNFGPHTPQEWLALSRPMLRPVQDGWTLHYDPDIAAPFKALMALQADPATRLAATQASEAQLWALYDAIACPTLVLRGRQSDLLTEPTLIAMQQRGPKAQAVQFDGVGHAPTLVAAGQVAAVQGFLDAP
jgi:pimeloyl-ACP methyl ester carboxylesterase